MKTPLDINEVLARLPGYKQIGPNRWQAYCPAHDDQNPSLSVGVGAGGILLLFCHAGCEFEEVLSSLQQQTILNGNGRVSEAIPEERLVATYVYCDEKSCELFIKRRYEPKRFNIAHKKENGRYVGGMGEHNPVLYRLPGLMKARSEEPVFIVEGEKDADRLASMGLVATTNFDGAGKWLPNYNTYFHGRTVWIIPDNDDAGKNHALKVANALQHTAHIVKIVELPGLHTHEDVSDWLDRGNREEELYSLCIDAVEWKPSPVLEQTQSSTLLEKERQIMGLQAVSMKSLLAKDFAPLVFLVDKLFALGHLSFLGGRPKSGKSWLGLQLAMCVDTQQSFLGKETIKAKVLLIALEDGERRIYERARHLGWEPSETAVVSFSIGYFNGPDSTPGPGLSQIEHAAAHFDLIIIDTLISALSGQAKENDNAQMGMIVNTLARISHQTDTSILVIHHTGKGNNDDIFNTLRGASAIRGGYDTGFILERNQGEKEAVLHAESRDIDLENMALRQSETGAGWIYLGNSHLIDEIRAGKKTIEAMLEIDPNGEGVTAKAVSRYRGVSETAVYNHLVRLVDDGFVERQQNPSTGKGKTPDLYFVRESFR